MREEGEVQLQRKRTSRVRRKGQGLSIAEAIFFFDKCFC